MVQKRLLRRTVGVATLAAVALGSAGFAGARTVPQSGPAASLGTRK